jgi:putative SOS response-associated peptidase YedK
LDPELSDRDTIRKVARRLDPGRLTAHRVFTKVNRPANDDPSLIEPVDDAPGPEETRS